MLSHRRPQGWLRPRLLSPCLIPHLTRRVDLRLGRQQPLHHLVMPVLGSLEDRRLSCLRNGGMRQGGHARHEWVRKRASRHMSRARPRLPAAMSSPRQTMPSYGARAIGYGVPSSRRLRHVLARRGVT